MSRTKTPVEFNTFVKGLITEASPLTFPDNASLEDYNFVLNRDGSRDRRLGMDYEPSYAIKDSGLTDQDLDVDTFIWRGVNEDPNLSIGVVKIGNRLWFVDSDTETFSSNYLNAGNYIEIPGVALSQKFSFASIVGDLVVATGGKDINIITYNSSSKLLSIDITKRLLIRDFFGIDDGLRLDERSATNLPKRRFNLFNQGWPLKKTHFVSGDINGVINNRDWYHTATFKGLGVYPSNSDIWSTGMKVNVSNAGVSGVEEYDPRTIFEFNNKAPRGHFVIDAFNRGDSRRSQVTTRFVTAPENINPSDIPLDQSNGGIIALESYASRVWYLAESTDVELGDENSPKLSTFVFFSQTVDSRDDINRCYQEADPTNKDISDLIATDGGYIQIPEMQNPIRMELLGRSLLIFAENGVWEIRGQGVEEQFKADNFQINKITREGVVGSDSVISTGKEAMYFSRGGIQIISRNQIGALEAQNITQTTIQGFYDAIPAGCKEGAKGEYDFGTQTVRWLYKLDTDTSGDNCLSFCYDRELVFDLNLQAWYTNRFPERARFQEDSALQSNPCVSGYLNSSDFVKQENIDGITVGGDVVSAGSELVGVLTYSRSRNKSAQKFLSTLYVDNNLSFTFSQFTQEEFYDWKVYTDSRLEDPSDAMAVLVTGYLTGGDTQRDKEATYLTVHCRRTETGFQEQETETGLEHKDASSCLVQAQWGWSNSSASGRWSREFQAYRYPRLYIPEDVDDPLDTGMAVISTRSKIRGKGKALSLQFRSEEGKDLRLLGWAMPITVEDNV